MLGHHKAKEDATWKTEERVQGHHDEIKKGCWEARFLAVSRGSLIPRSEKSSRFCTWPSRTKQALHFAVDHEASSLSGKAAGLRDIGGPPAEKSLPAVGEGAWTSSVPKKCPPLAYARHPVGNMHVRVNLRFM